MQQADKLNCGALIRAAKLKAPTNVALGGIRQFEGRAARSRQISDQPPEMEIKTETPVDWGHR